MDLKPCPKCGCHNVARERRPNGYTECPGCGHKVLSAEWDASTPPSDNDRLRADLNAANERIAELTGIAKNVARLGDPPLDHACAECVPHSDIIVDGFQCYYHKAVAIAGGGKGEG